MKEVIPKTDVRILELGVELSWIFFKANTKPNKLSMEAAAKPKANTTWNASTDFGISWEISKKVKFCSQKL